MTDQATYDVRDAERAEEHDEEREAYLEDLAFRSYWENLTLEEVMTHPS